MTRLSIPKRHRGAFGRFIRLNPTVLREFVGAIKKATPKASISNFASQIPSAKFGLDSESTYGILNFLVSIYRARSEFEIPIEEFASDLIATAKDELRNLPGGNKYELGALKKSIVTILKLDWPLGLTAKASELSSENERRLCPLNCRILSDTRPIFLNDPSKTPAAVLVQHVLKIAYHDAGDEVKEFYVTLDGDDLSYMQFILDRAKAKERSISKLMSKTAIPVLKSDKE